MRTALRLAGTAAVTCTAVLLPTAAVAAEPERTGWWSRLSAGGAALPQPTTKEGGLRISNGPDGAMAYSAVLYASEGARAATLTLAVHADRTLGTPDVLACVTEDTEWPEGGNQPWGAAPAYDCDAGSAFGDLAADGTTLTFLLDPTQQSASGAWSLALVPTPGTSAPFNLELAAPAADAFVAQPAPAEEPFPPAEPEPSTGDDGGGSTASTGTGESFLSGFEVPAESFDGGSTEMPPLVAEGDAAELPPAPEPAVAAGPAAPPPVVRASPARAVEDLGAGRRLLALLVLAGGSAAVGYAAAQQRPGPRLIGGRARVVAASTAASTAGPATSTAVSPQDRPRGIGRFAKERDAAPRRLR